MVYFGPYHENKVLQIPEIWLIFKGCIFRLSKILIRISNYRSSGRIFVLHAPGPSELEGIEFFNSLR